MLRVRKSKFVLKMSEQQKDFIIIGCIVCGCLRLLVCVCVCVYLTMYRRVCVMTAYDLAN